MVYSKLKKLDWMRNLETQGSRENSIIINNKKEITVCKDFFKGD